MYSKRKKHPITLLEIMIVILLIGLIGGVLSYNLKGTLDRGKKFRTEEGMRRLQEILNMELEKGPYSVSQITGKYAQIIVKQCVQNSGLIPSKDIDKFLKDGWGKSYYYTFDEKEGMIIVHSHTLDSLEKTSRP